MNQADKAKLRIEASDPDFNGGSKISVNAKQLIELLNELEEAQKVIEFYANEVQKNPDDVMDDYYAECPLGWRARQFLKEHP